MAALNATWPNLLDLAKRVDPDGRAAVVAEVMNQVNPILDDIPIIEGNLPTGNQATLRAGLATPNWRVVNTGTSPSKTTTIQVTDACGRMEDFSQLDEVIYDLNGASDAFRSSEDVGKMQGMGQEYARAVFYGNTETNPEQILGLSPRYGALTGAVTSPNVIDGQALTGTGGGSDNTSMWLCGWDPTTGYGITPKGQPSGIQVKNLGKQLIQNSPGLTDGKLLMAYVTQMIWNAGLQIKDWQAFVRIANIDVSDLKADVLTTLLDYMLQAQSLIPQRLFKVGRPVWYCNPTIFWQLQRLAMIKTVSQLTTERLEKGGILMAFFGVPIKQCDALLNTEALVA